jgi:hypothetical protein
MALNTVLRMLGLVVWMVLMALIFRWEMVRGGLGVAGTLLAGALIGRWWAVLVPVGLGLIFFVAAFFIDGAQTSDSGPLYIGLAGFILALLAAATLSLGLAIGEGVRRRSAAPRAHRPGVG